MDQFIHVGIVDISICIHYRVRIEAIGSTGLRGKLDGRNLSGHCDLYSQPVASDLLAAADADIVLVIMIQRKYLTVLIGFATQQTLIHIVAILCAGGTRSFEAHIAVAGSQIVGDPHIEMSRIAGVQESCAEIIGFSGLKFVSDQEIIAAYAIVIGCQHIHIGIVYIAIGIILGVGIEIVCSAALRGKGEDGHIASGYDLRQHQLFA